MREYDQSGSLVNTQDLLKEHGFELGCHVSRKDGILAKIQAFEDGTSMVVLAIDDAKGGRVVKVDAASFLKGQWAKYQPKALPQYRELVGAKLLRAQRLHSLVREGEDCTGAETSYHM